MAQMNRIGGRADNLRQMLLAAGIGDFNAVMSIPSMYFLPRTTDPNAQATIQLIEGLQNLLNGRGEHLDLTGTLTVPTIAALKKYAGPGWADKTWMQLYGDVLRGRRAPGFGASADARATRAAPAPAPTAVGNPLEVVSDLMASPLAWLAAGGLAYYVLRNKPKLGLGGLLSGSKPRPPRRLSSSSSYKRIRV